jgi:lipoprotein NlpD
MGELKVHTCQSRLQADNLNKSPTGSGLLLLAAVLLFVSFAPFLPAHAAPSKASAAKGVYHRVKRGETLVGIARAYGIPVQTIAEANRLKKTERIEKDRILFIPGARRVIDNTTPLGLAKKEREKAKADKKGRDKVRAPAKRDEPADKRTDKKKPAVEKKVVRKGTDDPSRKERPAKHQEDTRAPAGGKRFIWPVKGRIVSKFGIQTGGMFYNGIKIAAQPERPVVAVAPGVVIYSASLKDYGETVIVKHAGHFATVYTNLGERLVALDNRVRQGAKIGLVGAVEGKNEGFMTFEVRYKNKAVNPLRYLR